MYVLFLHVACQLLGVEGIDVVAVLSHFALSMVCGLSFVNYPFEIIFFG